MSSDSPLLCFVALFRRDRVEGQRRHRERLLQAREQTSESEKSSSPFSSS